MWWLTVALLHAAASTYVNSFVKVPYMDEIFHQPQTERYCNYDIFYWDNMITTFPGLYFFGVAWAKVNTVLGFGREHGPCSVVVLRETNAIFGFLSALCIRRLVGTIHRNATPAAASLRATVLVLAPTHFFFTTLYYTDVGSVFFVLWSYELSLANRHALSALAAAGAILFRQTNVVWCAFILGASVLRMVGSTKESGLAQVTAVLRALPRIMPAVLSRHAMHLALMVSFVAFAWINEGIVVGDRTSHKPMMHLPQILYGAAFVTAVLGPWSALVGRASLPCFIVECARSPATLCCALAITGLAYYAVRFYSYEHPFLLADNRHYTFYLWRYLFQRYEIARYLYTPVYAFCVWSLNRRLDQQMILWRFGLFVCASAALIPAGLLELRYFTIPFMLVGLHVPVTRPSTNDILTLQLFVIVNAGTLYMFAQRPYIWGDSGEIARFMF